MPASRSGGPSPVPMATMQSTPASTARWMTCARSPLNCSSSRWQCESISILSILLEPRPYWYILEEACQHRRAALERCCHNHALRFDTPHFTGREVCDDHHLASNE